jgi:hypothetical protein
LNVGATGFSHHDAASISPANYIIGQKCEQKVSNQNAMNQAGTRQIQTIVTADWKATNHGTVWSEGIQQQCALFQEQSFGATIPPE